MVVLPLLLAALGSADTLELTLDQALRFALRQSPARVEASASQVQAASSLAHGLASILPSVNASVGYAKSDVSELVPESLQTGSDWNWTGTLTVSQVVFDPAVFAGLAAAFTYSNYYSTEAREQMAKLVYDVTASYLNLLKADLLRDAAAAALRRAEENLRVTEEKKKLGSASRIDSMRAAVYRSQAEIGLLASEKTQAAANEELKASLGISKQTHIRAVEELTEPAGFEFADPDSLVAAIEQRNPGLLMAKQGASAARTECAGAVARALPSVSAYWTSSYSDSAFPSSHRKWADNDAITYGLTASFPLLDLKSYILSIVDAASTSRRARAGATAAQLQTRAAAVSAILGYQEARQTYDYALMNLKLSQELRGLAEEQHRLGALSLADLFSVEADLAQAQATHIGALCDTYIQAAQLNYLLGVAEIEPKETR